MAGAERLPDVAGTRLLKRQTPHPLALPRVKTERRAQVTGPRFLDRWPKVWPCRDFQAHARAQVTRECAGTSDTGYAGTGDRSAGVWDTWSVSENTKSTRRLSFASIKSTLLGP